MDRHLPPFAALRCFEVAARHESFAAAAEILHLTPSAVSHQIRSLEEFLRRSLFIRSQRGVQLTAEGTAYARTIAGALDVIEEATRSLVRPTCSEVLTVQVAPSLASSWLVPRLSDFIHRHPTIQIRLLTNRADLDHRAHCEIRYGQGKWPHVDATLLWTERLNAMAAPGVAAALTSGQALKDAILIHTRSRAQGWRQFLDQHGLPAHAGPELHFDRTHLALEAARVGLGVALESPLLARPLLDEGHLVGVLPELAIEDESYFFVTVPNATNEAAYRFRIWLFERLPRADPAHPLPKTA